MAIFNLLASDIIDLELKLEGKLPVNRDELLSLINSWGRNENSYTFNKDDNEIKIKYCEQMEKYELSKLDVSEITNFSDIFKHSNFDGDISKWNVSNATLMDWMFAYAKKFNSSLNNWDTSKVISMSFMFYKTENFNQNLNSWNISQVKKLKSLFACTISFNQSVLWDLSNVDDCSFIFYNVKTFQDKFNNGKTLPYETNKIKNWLKDNQVRMVAIDIEENKGKELDNFLSTFYDIKIVKK